jgi:hypothetical protein
MNKIQIIQGSYLKPQRCFFIVLVICFTAAARAPLPKVPFYIVSLTAKIDMVNNEMILQPHYQLVFNCRIGKSYIFYKIRTPREVLIW